jgi:hypothetical protein
MSGTLILVPIVFAITLSLPAVPPTPLVTRPLSATMSSPTQAIVTTTYSAPAVLLGSFVELDWTDTVLEPAVILKAIGPCGTTRQRFVGVATVPAGGSSYTDYGVTAGQTLCYSVNGSEQTAVVPTIDGTPPVVTPPPKR